MYFQKQVYSFGQGGRKAEGKRPGGRLIPQFAEAGSKINLTKRQLAGI